ncbi:MAG: M20/M25/M40 family metallo-hydrolase, partial [Hymenobacteraceae bacterium]|nr:M20/M25/M40 family metallo-hydrolase [Hymenobacteraceae bacterium]
LAAEFARLGLQPYPGATGFAQNFDAWRAQPLSVQATIAGTPVAPDHVLVIPGQEQLTWPAVAPDAPRIVVVGPSDDPWKAFWSLRKPTQNVLLLLDTTHRKVLREMARVAAHYGLRAARPTFSTVVVATPAPVATTAYTISATARIEAVPLTNVVGYLPGADPARTHETVVFSAHYDHLGFLPAVNGDSIANGADDDASGTTAVVALAEYYRAQPAPARPLVFVAFAAEEIGGFGSQYFSRQLDPDHLVAMFNIEMIGKEAAAGPASAYITGYRKSTFGKLLNKQLKGTRARFVPDPYPKQQLFYRSDNATLARLGVPAHTISTARMPDDKLYHSVDDEVASLNLPNLTAVVQSIARSASGIVSGQQTPSRVKDAGERK